MTDTLNLTMVQKEEGTDKVISKMTVDWYDMDRADANKLNTGLVGAALGFVVQLADEKAEYQK